MRSGRKYKRKSSNRQKFLRSKRVKKTPRGKQVVHKKSLWKGGTDTVRNLKLQEKSVHKKKTAKEARGRARKRKK